MISDTLLKILIIKTGFSETFTPEIEDKVSLGDVLRSTALLHLFHTHRVTWLTSEAAMPILASNKGIAELLAYNLTSVMQLLSEEFDVVVNLEKVPGICALASKIAAWQRYGFRFNSVDARAEAYVHSTEALYVANNEDRKAANKKHWLALLYNMIGVEWKGEGYILGYTPTTTEIYDVGLNYKAGRKFEHKIWPIDNWVQLEMMLHGNGMRIGWQPQETSVTDYIDWVNQCKLLVTNDSLGLHVAIALGKSVVGLFGPTPAKEIHPLKNGIMIQRRKISDIEVETVCDVVKSLSET